MSGKKLYVVGMGPGDELYMTREALNAIEESDVIAGYKVYINLLPEEYRSTEQIRESAVLSLDNPPMRYNLSFEGVETNEEGLISEADLLSMFDRTIAEYDELYAKYTKETLDKAA